MTGSRSARLAQILREKQIDHAVLSSVASLRYFTGFTASIETGPSPFTPVAGVLLVERGGEPLLLLADSEPIEGVFSGMATSTFISYKEVHARLGLQQRGTIYGTSPQVRGLNSLASWALS